MLWALHPDMYNRSNEKSIHKLIFEFFTETHNLEASRKPWNIIMKTEKIPVVEIQILSNTGCFI
jgi:hypothetical protein